MENIKNINTEILIEEIGMGKSPSNKENTWIRELEWSEIPDFNNEDKWENDEDEH